MGNDNTSSKKCNKETVKFSQTQKAWKLAESAFLDFWQLIRGHDELWRTNPWDFTELTAAFYNTNRTMLYGTENQGIYYTNSFSIFYLAHHVFFAGVEILAALYKIIAALFLTIRYFFLGLLMLTVTVATGFLENLGLIASEAATLLSQKDSDGYNHTQVTIKPVIDPSTPHKNQSPPRDENFRESLYQYFQILAHSRHISPFLSPERSPPPHNSSAPDQFSSSLLQQYLRQRIYKKPTKTPTQHAESLSNDGSQDAENLSDDGSQKTYSLISPPSSPPCSKIHQNVLDNSLTKQDKEPVRRILIYQT